jgi:hypothetical protein
MAACDGVPTMSIPSPIVYTPLNTQVLSLGPILDAQNNNAVLLGGTCFATLTETYPQYIEIPGATHIPLVDDGRGIYIGTIDGAGFNPDPGIECVTKIDFTDQNGNVAHWEIPSEVSPRTS